MKIGRILTIAKKLPFLLFLCLMLLFPAATLEGASSGLLLWFQTILPVLLPFIILSGLVIRLGLIRPITRILYPIFSRILPVSQNGCYPVFIGFLSGLPMGAKTAADLTRENKISPVEGRYLVALCNNASPMFILNYIAAVQLKLPELGLILCTILYLSAVLSSGLAFHQYKNKKIHSAALTAASLSDSPEIRPVKHHEASATLSEEIDRSILDGFTVITKIGGYVILFSILSSYLSMLPLPETAASLLSCILEITTGIHQLSVIDLPWAAKFIIVLAATAFGGLSGLAQTQSVIHGSGLSIWDYIKVKLLNVVVAVLLGILFLPVLLR